MNWLTLVLSLIQLLPQLVPAIKAVETAVGAGHGATKKAIVMAPLVAAPVEVQQAASAFIDRTVAVMKADSLLGTPPVAPPAAPAAVAFIETGKAAA